MPCHLWQRELAKGSLELEIWSCPSPTTAHERAGPTPHLRSTLELTLLVGGTRELVLWMRKQESGTSFLPCMPCCRWHGWENIPSSQPLPTAAGRRADFWDTRTKELPLFLTNCSSPESKPYTWPGQDSGAGSGGVHAGEPDVQVREQENRPCSLLPATVGELAGSVLESAPWG